MLVILLKKVNNLGDKFDILDVKPGFARNFLLPQGLAKKATEKNIKWAQEKQEEIAKKAEKELEQISNIASRLDGREIEIGLRVGKKGQIFGGITPTLVAKKLKQEGFDIKKSQINIPQKIEELGEFPVKIELEHNLEATINLLVKQEGNDEQG